MMLALAIAAHKPRRSRGERKLLHYYHDAHRLVNHPGVSVLFIACLVIALIWVLVRVFRRKGKKPQRGQRRPASGSWDYAAPSGRSGRGRR